MMVLVFGRIGRAGGQEAAFSVCSVMNRSISAGVTRRVPPTLTHPSCPPSKSRYTEDRLIRNAAATSGMVRSKARLGAPP